MPVGNNKPGRSQRLVLHIGMHKTGSTAIQASMSNSRVYLLSKGVNYLSGIRMNHSTTFVSLFAEQPHRYHINIQDGFNTPDKARAHNKRLERIVRRQFQENRSEVFVISGEGLSILSEPAVRALKKFVEPYFNEIEVVCYVRGPLEFYRSMCQQYIVGGRPEKELQESPPMPGYQFRLGKFIRVFGVDNVRVKLYDRKHLKNGDIVDDFASLLGMSETELRGLQRKSTNESLSDSAVRIINIINERTPVFVNNALNPERGPFIRGAFLRAAERSKDRKFAIPVYYDRSHVAEINEDVSYVNALLPEGQRIEPVTKENPGRTDMMNRDLNPVYLAELVNELQLVAERRRVRINNLEKKLRARGWTGILRQLFGK